MKNKKSEGSIDELYGYLVCVKPTSAKSSVAVYVFAGRDSTVSEQCKADALARKLRRLMKPRPTATG